MDLQKFSIIDFNVNISTNESYIIDCILDFGAIRRYSNTIDVEMFPLKKRHELSKKLLKEILSIHHGDLYHDITMLGT